MFLFPQAVDRATTDRIYPHVAHLAADCFITTGLYFLSRGALSHRRSRAHTVALVAFLVALCSLFFMIPRDLVPDRISAVMFDDPRFFLYAVVANLAVLFFTFPLLRLSRHWVTTGSAVTVGRVMTLVGVVSWVYVAGRLAVSFNWAPSGLAVVVSSVFSLSLSLGLGFVVVTQAFAYRRRISDAVDALTDLDDYLSTRSGSPVRRHRLQLLFAPMGLLVDLIALTSDKISLLDPDDPVRQVATRRSQEEHGQEQATTAYGYSLERAGRTLFDAAATASSLTEDVTGEAKRRAQPAPDRIGGPRAG